jgi:hypothetical protein
MKNCKKCNNDFLFKNFRSMRKGNAEIRPKICFLVKLFEPKHRIIIEQRATHQFFFQIHPQAFGSAQGC